VLEFVEEALDEVTLAIEVEIAWQWNRAARVGRNHRDDFPVGKDCQEAIGVICLVADQSRWISIGEQRLCTSEIVGLAWRQHQLDRIAQCIDERVNLGAQSAARSADRLRAIFFRAPALCW